MTSLPWAVDPLLLLVLLLHHLLLHSVHLQQLPRQAT
jgi:hypothetical protein